MNASKPVSHNTKTTHNTAAKLRSSWLLKRPLGITACKTASTKRMAIIQRAAITSNCNHNSRWPVAFQRYMAATAANNSNTGHKMRWIKWRINWRLPLISP